MVHHEPLPVFAARASAILYHLVMSLPTTRGVYLLPANVCPVVPLTLLAAQRPFEFIDLDEMSLCMSPALVGHRLTARQRAPVAGILFVRTYGATLDMTVDFRAWKTLQPELLLIDDRCLARPVLDRTAVHWQGADVVLFSTGYAKPVDVGFGGFAHLQPYVSWQWHPRPFVAADEHTVTALYQAHIRKQRPLYEASAHECPPRHFQTLQWLDTRAPHMPWSPYRALVLKAEAAAESHAATLLASYRHHIPERAHLPFAYHAWRFQLRVPRRDALLKKIFAAGYLL